MAKHKGGKKPPRKQGGGKSEVRKDDIYEADDVELPEDQQANRYDRVESYEYELPSDFEDEEIDEDMAFTEEDKALYGHLFDDKDAGARSAGEEEGGSGEEGGLLESESEEGGEEEGGSEDWGEEEDDELAMFGEGEDPASEGGSEEGEEEAEGAEGGRGAEDGEGEEDEQQHKAMLAAVTGGSAAGKKGRRRKEVVVTEVYPESEYNLGASGGGDLTLSDLIAGLGESKSKLGAARKALERLEKKAAPVSAPLPGPIKQRQERRAGYEETKQEVTKWMPLVKAHREAPTLRFTADKAAVPRTTTTAALAAKHVPETDMEAEVAALLERAGAHSARAVSEAEEALALKALSVEEARERQNRLAKMRALLFYHEVKAKRMKKIKSKEYHRKLKRAGKRRAGAGGGEAGDEAELQRMMEEAEFERAKERLTLKHKNTSRWARRALKRGTDLVDEGTKAALAEQLRLGQELRLKIDRMRPGGGGGSDSDGSTSASDDDAGDEEAGDTFSGPRAGGGMSSKVKAAALELLEGGGRGGLALGGESEGAGAGPEAPSKGLFALPFMRRALERKQAEAQEEARQILRELEAEVGEGEDEDKEEGAPTSGFGGRMAFGGGGEAVQQAQREVERRIQRAEAAALNSDSELEADEQEDTEAKTQRLGRRLAGEAAPGPDAAAAAAAAASASDPVAAAGTQGGSRRVGSQGQRLANGGAAAALPLRSAGATEGPISIELPSRRRGREGAAGEQQQQAAEAGGEEGDGGQLAVQHRRLLAAGSGGGKAVRKGGRQQQQQAQQSAPLASTEGVSIGPASPVAAATQRDAQQGGADEASAPFVAARKFAGARLGYVFKKGPKGVGYYQDGEERAKAARLQKKAHQAQQRAQQQANGTAAAPAAADSEDDGNMQPMEQQANGGGGLSQEDMVRMAFAGDDVAAQFAADKAEEVQGELPKAEEPGVLPGWGLWATQQREPKWMAEAREKAKRQRAAAEASRKDAKLQYVVICEKWDKKSAKYRTPSVPFPFDSKDTYERAMRQPLGREYNTDASFRNLTRPAVLKDAGVIIEPIRFSKHAAQEAGKPAKAGKRPAVATVAGGMPKRSKAAKK